MAEGNDHLGEIRNVCWNTLERLPELVYPPTVGQNLFTADCQPSQEQADYILKTNLDNKFVIFDNAVWSDTSSSISLEQKFDRIGARMQLKAANHSGKWQKVFLDYTKKYNKQLDCIIKGMFGNDAAGDPSN